MAWRCVRRLAELLSQQAPAEMPVWVILARPSQPAIGSVYCLHPAGGDVRAYVPLADRLASEAWLVRGLAARSTLDPADRPSSLVEMANAHARSIADVHVVAHASRSPLVLVGWSSGGVLAAAVTHELEGLGVGVDLLVLLDPTRRLAGETRIVADRPPADAVLRYARSLGVDEGHPALAQMSSETRTQLNHELAALPSDTAALERLIGYARAQGHVSPHFTSAVARWRNEVVVHASRLVAEYDPPRIACDVWARFVARSDAHEEASIVHSWSSRSRGHFEHEFLRTSHTAIVADDDVLNAAVVSLRSLVHSSW